MRGVVSDLVSPQRLAELLPGLLQDDEFAVGFVSAFDAVVAPIHHSLDNLDAYLDPSLAPEDFLTWLGDWVGVRLEENWSLERKRVVVLGAFEVYRWRGTLQGLTRQLELFGGVEAEIDEPGGVSWTSDEDGELPGSDELRMVIRVRPLDGGTVDMDRVEAIVAGAKPVHLVHEIQVVDGG